MTSLAGAVAFQKVTRSAQYLFLDIKLFWVLMIFDNLTFRLTSRKVTFLLAIVNK